MLTGINVGAFSSRKTSEASSYADLGASISAGFEDDLFPTMEQSGWDKVRFSDSPSGSLSLGNSQELTSSNEFQPRSLRRTSTGALFAKPSSVSSASGSTSLSRTGFGALPSRFLDDSFMLFEKPAFLSDLLKPVPSTDYLDNLRVQLGLDGVNSRGYDVGQIPVNFNQKLGGNSGFTNVEAGAVYGLTTRDEEAAIGPQAFSSTLRTANMTGVIELSPSLVALQVGLTMAHEMTHVYQYDNYPVINGEAINPMDMRKKFGAEVASEISKAYLAQINLFETLGYQVELLNLIKYKDLHAIDNQIASLAPLKNKITEEEIFQLQRMEDTIRVRRDDFFDQLPSKVQSLLLSSKIYEAQCEVIAIVKLYDPDLILPPLQPENDAGSATTVPDDETVVNFAAW